MDSLNNINKLGKIIVSDYKRNKFLILMILPVLAYYIIFHYGPMYGTLIAFKNYSPRLGVWHSPWVGLEYFYRFFENAQFGKVFFNTLKLSLYQIAFGFPAPLILALMLNQIKNVVFKKAAQTISYMPHFISIVVMAGMIVDFCSTDGIITQFVSKFTGGSASNLLLRPELFRPIYIISGIWQEIGFGSIIYLGALSAIDLSLYDAAIVDGANRFKQIIHIELPTIAPTIAVLFLLRIGGMMNIGYEKVILLYNANTYETADIISTFVYRMGLMNMDYSFGAAIGLFNSVINLSLLVTFNWLSKKYTSHGLW